MVIIFLIPTFFRYFIKQNIKEEMKVDFENDSLFANVITRIELLSRPLIMQTEEAKIEGLLE
jgi:hypothetical protein